MDKLNPIGKMPCIYANLANISHRRTAAPSTWIYNLAIANVSLLKKLTWMVNSANKVRITNSPGRMSVSMLILLGNLARSLGAPQGNTCEDVSRSKAGGTVSYSSSFSSSSSSSSPSSPLVLFWSGVSSSAPSGLDLSSTGGNPDKLADPESGSSKSEKGKIQWWTVYHRV